MNRLFCYMGRAMVAGAALFTSLPQEAQADDIFKAMRGPTDWQLDSRVAYSRNSQGVAAVAGNAILKYWNGSGHGWWGFLNLPYRAISSQNSSSAGPGDVSLGTGPRGSAGNFHVFSYLGLTFPTGDEESKPALGN